MREILLATTHDSTINDSKIAKTHLNTDSHTDGRGSLCFSRYSLGVVFTVRVISCSSAIVQNGKVQKSTRLSCANSTEGTEGPPSSASWNERTGRTVTLGLGLTGNPEFLRIPLSIFIFIHFFIHSCASPLRCWLNHSLCI